jgi:hypothetical protein
VLYVELLTLYEFDVPFSLILKIENGILNELELDPDVNQMECGEYGAGMSF